MNLGFGLGVGAGVGFPHFHPHRLVAIPFLDLTDWIVWPLCVARMEGGIERDALIFYAA